MTGASRKKTVAMTLFFIAFFSLAATCQPAKNRPSMMDSSLIDELFKLKFNVSTKVSFIDSNYFNYMKLYDSDYCIAEPRQKFSETDNREIGLCWDRLVFAGKSGNRDNEIELIVYQDGRVGTRMKKCDIIKTHQAKIVAFVSIFVHRNAKNLKLLKQMIREERITVDWRPLL